MIQLKFNFPQEYFSPEGNTLEEKIDWFEDFGFELLQDDAEKKFYVPERITLPTKEVLDLDEIYKELEKLESGNKRQIMFLQTLEYYNLFDIDDRLPLLEGRNSYVSDEDIYCVKKRYSNINQ